MRNTPYARRNMNVLGGRLRRPPTGLDSIVVDGVIYGTIYPTILGTINLTRSNTGSCTGSAVAPGPFDPLKVHAMHVSTSV